MRNGAPSRGRRKSEALRCRFRASASSRDCSFHVKNWSPPSPYGCSTASPSDWLQTCPGFGYRGVGEGGFGYRGVG